ncbi:flagellin modification protein, PseA [Candidatus Kaiserbacteria bacterium RIFCSPHIGHO2_02_FULL_49_16]|uniref:Flagellin modification protein, PseA n=1 Tax=Candidatus Kaiserbacteria bacterium RIFCSPHIGHO2_02_FULL_49_16 TaxID=1798490 RepID=A0A1F6DH24_9BACT|nr:MAG: flagellin modification protein, PseA [Candidatus Kaiserbacteria bacterium RIFCSPHIGHO2_02_FULL_49_16]
MPDTKPDLSFDEKGVCDACLSAAAKKTINWQEREAEFKKLVERFKRKDSSNYDCIIPVSGGKDSHYQAYIARKSGLNPLLVHFEPTMRTELGLKNLENIRRFGDMLELKKNPNVYKKMVIEGFRRVGDNEWPNHIGIFTFPIRVAVAYKIPLIIWGENSQLEYGGPKASRMKNTLDRRWLEEFGGLLGLRVEDMVGVEGISEQDLIPYQYPTDEELQVAGITGVFLGYYKKWDARSQTELMQKNGFSIKEDGLVEGTYTNYENLDEATVGVHDYLKFVKFGFGRATDHACLDIRNGRMAREEGVALVKKYDGKLPKISIADFLAYSSMSRKEFDSVMDSFTDKAIFMTDEHGSPLRDNDGNLIKKYQDYSIFTQSAAQS